MNTRYDWVMLLGVLVLTAVVASTAYRIEILNRELGGYLPRTEQAANNKWRTTSPDMAEEMYRRELAYVRGLNVEDDEQLANLELSVSEQNEIVRIRENTILNNELRKVVSSMGQFQYLLVPMGVLLSLILVVNPISSVRIPAMLCIVINLIAGYLMFDRAYFSSLGW